MPEPGGGQTIELTGARARGTRLYVCGPADARWAVLVTHEWWGLKDHNRRWVEGLAAAGYRAAALDLYDGRVTHDPTQAKAWMRALDQAAADDKLRAALDFLRLHERRIATLGFSLGGRQALRAAVLEPATVHAVVAGYCTLPREPQALRALAAPVLAIYAKGEPDWQQRQRDFEAAMAAAGKRAVAAVFDGGHGFADPDSPRYDAATAGAAWEAALVFLGRTLAH